MELSSCRLRPLIEKDLEMVLAWRNADRVRLNMASNHVIGMDEHRAWHRNTVRDATQAHYIFEIQERPFGVVNVTNINPERRDAQWGFYVGERVRPPGTGTAMGIMALDLVFGKFHLNSVYGKVVKHNTGSQQYHHRFGFRQVDMTGHPLGQGGDETLLWYGLIKSEWDKKRASVLKLIKDPVKI